MTRSARNYVFHVQTDPAETGLGSSGAIMVDQLRFVSIERFLNRQPVGRVDAAILARIETLLKAALDIP
jgi:mRNA-degrading endonuclease toxin of MazEF toxin-antitoxin module